jgi:ribosomal protein S1
VESALPIGSTVAATVRSFDLETGEIRLDCRRATTPANVPEPEEGEILHGEIIRRLTRKELPGYSALLVALDNGLVGKIRPCESKYAALNPKDRVVVKALGRKDQGLVALSLAPMAESACEQMRTRVNQVMPGKVESVQRFGYFVRLAPLIVGLLNTTRCKKGEKFAVGDDVLVRLAAVTPGRQGVNELQLIKFDLSRSGVD